MQTKPRDFTLAIHGSGKLRPEFQRVLQARYPTVTVYDQNRAAGLQATSPLTPFKHPEVADIDVFFKVSGSCDEITLRCGGRHRFFRFDPGHAHNDNDRLERLLQAIVGTVEQLLTVTGTEPDETPVDSETLSETPDDSPGEAT